MHDMTTGMYHGKATTVCASTSAPWPVITDRVEFASVVHEDVVYVCGGKDPTTMTLLDTCAKLDLKPFLTSGTAPVWDEMPVVMGHAREHISMAVTQNKVS